jgi:choline-sulfatase
MRASMLPALLSRGRRHPALAALLLLPLLLAGCRRPRPNVLLITIDTLRADHVGCYGYGPAYTPNIDALAAQGVRCDNAVSAAPITMPSHSSILTGLFPPAHGVRDNGTYALGDRAVTLAERMKAAGYETQAFVSAAVLNRRYNLTQGFDGYDDDLWTENAPKLFMIRDRKGTRTAERVLAWLGKWERRPGRPPFFAWVHLFDPHQPYDPDEIDSQRCALPYDAEIAGADRAVGMILDRLRRDGLLADTLVVLTADHGESLGEHKEKTHAIFVYDATMRVPLVWRFPRTFPAGRVYRGPVRTVDIVPTVLGVLGLPGASETQGVDLGAPLAGRAPAPELPQYIESLVSEVGFGMAPLVGVRLNGFKLIRAPRPELYDLRHDPHELSNMYSKDARQAAALDRRLDEILADSGRRSIEAKESPMNRETLETLMSLGYLAPRRERETMGGMDPKDGIVIHEDLENARHFAQKRRWAAAERILRGILEKIPGHVSARNVLALTLLRQGDLEGADAEYKRSLETDPKQSRVLSMLGTVALLGDHDAEAERYFRAALGMTPGFVEAMSQMGLLEASRGNETQAREWYEKALAADPGFPRAHKLYADLLYDRGDFARALEQYQRVVATQPRDFAALVQAGGCARRLGDSNGARDWFRRAEEVRPRSWVPPYNEACLEASLGKPEPALKLLETAEKRGLDDIPLLEADPDLASLRSSPRFRAIVARLRSDD